MRNELIGLQVRSHSIVGSHEGGHLPRHTRELFGNVPAVLRKNRITKEEAKVGVRPKKAAFGRPRLVADEAGKRL